MARGSTGLFLGLSQRVRAPRERVFDLLTMPDELARWWGPRGFTTPEVSVELRVGGRYRLTMQPPDGAVFHLAGEYVEIDRPNRLGYTFDWEEPDPDDRTTVVHLALDDIDGATVVSLSQGEFATPARLDLHRNGWTGALQKLADVAESLAAG
jgi:uncharacterized protein YndB with AHSA1/START domain